MHQGVLMGVGAVFDNVVVELVPGGQTRQPRPRNPSEGAQYTVPDYDHNGGSEDRCHDQVQKLIALKSALQRRTRRLRSLDDDALVSGIECNRSINRHGSEIERR